MSAKLMEGRQDKAAGLGSVGGFENGRHNAKHLAGNSSEAQRARLLTALRQRPHTTIELRRMHDILHPAGRVMELRRLGETIATHRITDVTNEGKSHRVARYLLVPGVRP